MGPAHLMQFHDSPIPGRGQRRETSHLSFRPSDVPRSQVQHVCVHFAKFDWYCCSCRAQHISMYIYIYIHYMICCYMCVFPLALQPVSLFQNRDKIFDGSFSKRDRLNGILSVTQQARAQVIEQFAEDGVAKWDGKILSEASASWSSRFERVWFLGTSSCIRGSEFCGQSLVKPCLEHVEVLGEELVEDPGRWEENSAGGAEAGYNTVPQNAFQVLQQYLDKVLYFLCISSRPCFNGQQWEPWENKTLPKHNSRLTGAHHISG